MEVVIETYADGSRMVSVDDKRYYVREYKAVSFGTVGETPDCIPARALCYSCEEVKNWRLMRKKEGGSNLSCSEKTII